MKKKNVMVIIDETNSSYDFLVFVLQNQKDTIENSKLLIFAKQPQNSFAPSSVGFSQILYPFSSNIELIKLAQEKNNKIALGILEKAKKIGLNYGIEAETLTDVGDPKIIIHEIIQEKKIDFIVMSDQQNHNLKKCVHNTDCSLLVVKKDFARIKKVTKH